MSSLHHTSKPSKKPKDALFCVVRVKLCGYVYQGQCISNNSSWKLVNYFETEGVPYKGKTRQGLPLSSGGWHLIPSTQSTEIIHTQ
jgi:hypothetical protein